MRLLLYIDPGTGSMLFAILIGLLGTGAYFARKLAAKLKFLLSGGREKSLDQARAPFVIFSDSKRYWNLFEPICRVFEAQQIPLEYLTASPDDPALSESYKYVKCQFIGEGNRAFAKLNFLKADILLSTTPGLDVLQWKRSRDVKWYVHVLHMASDPTTYRMFGLDYYDAVLFSGEYQIRQRRQLDALRGLPEKEMLLVGQPYLDAMKERLEKAPPLAEHPVTVLLAPSWGESAILSRFGKEMIAELMKTGYYIIIRPHPQSFTAEQELMEELMQAFPSGSQLEWNRDNDNFEVLRRADVMISDFSGVIFDYCLVFGRPVLYADTAFDKAPYDAAWLEEELWTFEVLPKIGRPLKQEDFPHLREKIEALLGDSLTAEAIEQARRESWVHEGESAARIADYMVKKQKELSSGNPL